MSSVAIEAALLLLVKHSAWWTDEDVVAWSSTHVVDVAPVVIVVHVLLILLVASELGGELASDVIAIEHESSVGLWLWSQNLLWQWTVRRVGEVHLVLG